MKVALTLATLGGSAIARATHGLIQLPPPVAAVVIPLVPATGGGTNVYSEDVALLAYRFESVGMLLLQSETRFYHTVKLQPVPLYDYYDAAVPLYLSSESTWQNHDQGAIDDDDEEVLLLLAAYRL